MKSRFFVAFLFVSAAIVVSIALVASPAHAQKAKQQVNSFGNTGVVFDGSDGKRSGMDTTVTKPTGKVPDVPAPTRVDTSTGTAGGYSVGTSTGTASGKSGTNSGPTKKTGSEKAH